MYHYIPVCTIRTSTYHTRQYIPYIQIHTYTYLYWPYIPYIPIHAIRTDTYQYLPIPALMNTYRYIPYVPIHTNTCSTYHCQYVHQYVPCSYIPIRAKIHAKIHTNTYPYMFTFSIRANTSTAHPWCYCSESFLKNPGNFLAEDFCWRKVHLSWFCQLGTCSQQPQKRAGSRRRPDAAGARPFRWFQACCLLLLFFLLGI